MRGIRTRIAIVGLALCLAVGPAPLLAQPAAPSVAIVVGSVSEFSSWGYAPTVPLGQPITWTNFGAQPHTATFQGTAWDTGIVAPGAAGALVFDAPGLYAYVCALHPNMTGSVLVSEDPAVSIPSLSIVEPDPADVSSWGYALSLQVGQSVTWWNVDGYGQPHTATSSEGVWDTATIQPGGAAALPFDAPGLYGYICTPHPWMKARLQIT